MERLGPAEEQADLSLVLCTVGIDVGRNPGVVRARAAVWSLNAGVSDQDRRFVGGEANY